MHTEPILYTMFLIFTGAAALATLALYARQALIVVYIVLGILFGPSVLGLVADPVIVRQVSHIGIMFLLFLLGVSLPPQKLLRLVRETTLVAGTSSLLFAVFGAGAGWLLGFTPIECALIGAALMFSSTIIGLKLLPTTVLHHQRTGELIISVLLLQDLAAIVILLLLQTQRHNSVSLSQMGLLALSLPLLITFAYLCERYVLVKLIGRFDRIREYIFLMAIGWCLGIAQLASSLGLSYEIGAFIAGVALATSPISLFIAESLKPLRDFFLILFFFSLGASFNLDTLVRVLPPALALAALVLIIKPWVFSRLLRRAGEDTQRADEIGLRLGQISEFSLLIAALALDLGVIRPRAAYLIELSTLLTFVASTYLVVLRYPTPIALSDAMRRD